MRLRRIVFLVVLSLLVVAPIDGQSPNGTISGLVVDSSGAAIVGAEILIANDATGLQYPGKTNGDGFYLVPNLPPGTYRLQISKVGFKTLIKPDITLNVQDALAINFTLPIGAVSEIVTVTAGAPLVNTQDAAVSTVVDRQFVENLPLNGRSFQTLIMLTSGVVLTATSTDEPGQFSVNGQRADANYFTVDGVSANIGVSSVGGLGQTAGGAVPGFSVLGGTNTLVSVDAMQEFRIQTSSFAPEFGRTPGGQVSIATRSGTNDFHGTLFDYFRNTVLDANNWFNNAATPPLPKAPEHQNDFGGVVGGPINKGKTFFFFSYEGLRLRQPQSQKTTVPDTGARQTAAATAPGVLPFLDAFPVQNGPELGNGLAEFNASYSSPSTLDAYSLRIDHSLNSKLTMFGRYNYAPSQAASPITGTLSDAAVSTTSTQTFTLGLAGILSKSMNNELRANYSNYRFGTTFRLTSFGGAVPLPDSTVFPPGFSSENGTFGFFAIGAGSFIQGKIATNEQRQVNLVDNLSVTAGAHSMKFGADYRWLAPFHSPPAYQQNAVFLGLTGPSGVLSGTALDVIAFAFQSSALLSHNYSVYGQDTWKVTPRLTLTYGLRWDINPPVSGKSPNGEPFTVTGLNDPATLSLAPRGTPLYSTTYGNVAPRVGAAYQLRQEPGWETVLRGGFGTFYDLGTGSLGNETQGFPYGASKLLSNVPFPVPAQQAAPPPLNLNLPISSNLYVAVPDLKLPRTYQWNAAVEQSFGASQTLSLTYVGALGRDLLRQNALQAPNANFSPQAFLFVTRNTATSDYHALQLKLQRRLSKGVQALASYTLSHAIDIASNDSYPYNTPAAVANPSVDRGNSDFDVRHSFTAAVSYDLPVPRSKGTARAILGYWSVDTFVLARSALPVMVLDSSVLQDGIQFDVRPDVVPGIPLYVFGAQYPGGKAFNPAAFTGLVGDGRTPPGTIPVGADGNPLRQGTLGRNVLRGFDAWQADFAVRRQFHMTDRLTLQFRAEFFNVFNHPNFGDPSAPNNEIINPLFGQSTQNLANSLGTGGAGGGFNPLYQIGGPRSIQLALKLQF